MLGRVRRDGVALVPIARRVGSASATSDCASLAIVVGGGGKSVGIEDRCFVELIEPNVDRRQHVVRLVDTQFREDHGELVLKYVEHASVDRRLEDEVVCDDVTRLADSVDSSDPLFDPRRAPREVVVDHDVGELQIDTLSAGVGRDEDPHVVLEGDLCVTPLGDRHRYR